MKKEKSKSQKIAELINLAMAVQVNTKYCVFIRMAGHVDKLEIEIRKSKKDYMDTIADSQFYFSDKWNDWFEKSYRKCKNVLISILQTGEFDPDHEDVDCVERIEYDYKF